MDITVPNQPDVPYIFRFEGDELLLVAPQMDMQKGFAVPDGFGEKATGLVHLTKGEPPVRSDKHAMPFALGVIGFDFVCRPAGGFECRHNVSRRQNSGCDRTTHIQFQCEVAGAECGSD